MRRIKHISMLLNGHDALFGESAFPIARGLFAGWQKNFADVHGEDQQQPCRVQNEKHFIRPGGVFGDLLFAAAQGGLYAHTRRRRRVPQG